MTTEERNFELYKEILRDMRLGEKFNRVHAQYLENYVAQLNKEIAQLKKATPTDEEAEESAIKYSRQDHGYFPSLENAFLAGVQWLTNTLNK